jgi:hypothetical protein
LTTLFITGIWYGGLLFEAVLLMRGFFSALLRKYPLFYSYIFVVFASEVLRMVAHRWQPGIYNEVYWITQFIALIGGSAVMFEVYQIGLASFPGTARIARNILFLVFALLLAKSIAIASPGGLWAWITQTPVDLERDLRSVQAIALIALVGLFRAYAIPVDRNLKGILVGYGLFVASGVVQLAAVSRWWTGAQNLWSYAQPLCYLLVLGVWVNALWSYQPAAARTSSAGAAMDYEIVASTTRRRFQKAYSELLKSVRP